MKATLFSKNGAEPLGEAKVDIRRDSATGAPFEARLGAVSADLIVALNDGVVLLADDGARYEGSVQQAFEASGHGWLVQGFLKSTPD